MNLFDVTHGWTGTGPASDKPRSATQTERNAYLRWLAEQRGVDIAGCTLAADGAWRGKGADAELVLAMPGYGEQPSAVMETLDDAGNVVRTTPLALDSKGYMVLKARQVQDACGLKPVRAKRRKAVPVVTSPDPVDIREPEIAAEPMPVVISAGTSDLVTQEAPAPAADPIAELLERVTALEARLATLSVQSTLTSSASDEGEEIKAKRTPAHERAIRRAWAERAAQRERADLDIRALLKVNGDNRLLLERLQAVEAERDTLATSARDALANLGREAQRAKAAEIALARLKRDMADPTTPERASDVARLMRERDEARNANAALQARAERSERAVADLADRFESMGTRLAIAEATVRRAAA